VCTGEPAEGADGADIVIVCDPALDSLLHLHKRKEWAGKRGAQGNPAVGSAGAKRSKDKKAATAPLEIPVPPGTVVKRKGTGQVGEGRRGGFPGGDGRETGDPQPQLS
jgi:GTPase involved in cell partitioning and DNA repair